MCCQLYNENSVIKYFAMVLWSSCRNKVIFFRNIYWPSSTLSFSLPEKDKKKAICLYDSLFVSLSLQKGTKFVQNVALTLLEFYQSESRYTVRFTSMNKKPKVTYFLTARRSHKTNYRTTSVRAPSSISTPSRIVKTPYTRIIRPYELFEC